MDEKSPSSDGLFFRNGAGIPGFEPRFMDSKSGALPLNYIPTTILIVTQFLKIRSKN